MSGSKPALAAFDQGEVPRIACFSRATLGLGVDLASLVAALQEYVDRHLAPVWGTPAHLVKSDGFLPGHWALVFLDDADAEGALGVHDLTPDGFPFGRVFMKELVKFNESVSLTASHELAEMLVDPAINMMTTGPRPNVFYAYESADPVEALSFLVRGLPMSDFVYPAYFEDFRQPGSTRFDHLHKVRRPFEILPGGYQIVFEEGQWRNVGANSDKDALLKREDRRGHRSESRPAGGAQRRASAPGRAPGTAGYRTTNPTRTDGISLAATTPIPGDWEQQWGISDGPTHIRLPGGRIGVFSLTRQQQGGLELFHVQFDSTQMDPAWQGCWLLPRGQALLEWEQDQLPPYQSSLQTVYDKAIKEALQRADANTLRLEGEITVADKKEAVAFILAEKALVGDLDLLIIVSRMHLPQFGVAPELLSRVGADQDGTGHAEPNR